MNTNNRRGFIKKLSIAQIGVVLASNGLFDPKTTQRSNISSSTIGSKIKLSLNAWSYNVPLFKYVKGEKGGMSLFDLLEECARLDFDAVDPTGYFFPGYPEAPSSKFINDFKRSAFQLGLDISGTGIRTDFANPNIEKRRSDVLLTKRWIEVAAELGAPVLRVFAGKEPKGNKWEEAAMWVSEALIECSAYAEQYGVMLGVQNHGEMLKSADEVLKILEMVDSDWLGVVVDTGSFLTNDPYSDIERVCSKAVNWQIKEILNNRKGPKIDLKKLVTIIRASNYRGYVPIETLPMLGKENNYNVYTRVPEFLAELRSVL